MNQQILEAIRTRTIVEFDYQGYHRVVEPHVYGALAGEDELLVYQIAGESSSGGLPQWRRMKVAAITNFKLTQRRFTGPRAAPSGKHSAWDVTYEIVT